MRIRHIPILAAVTIMATACTDPLELSPPEGITQAVLTSAFNSVPLGFSDMTSSFSGDSDGVMSMWLPGSRAAAFGADLMGGGIADHYVGAISSGRGFGHHGPFGGRFGGGSFTCTGSFNASTGRFVCDPVTRGGVTVNRSMRYTNAAGAVQQAFDTVTTNTVNVQSAATGTVSWARDSSSRGRGPRHLGRIAGDSTTILSVNTTVSHSSDRTVGGLASGSTQRTVNGTSGGTESMTGTSSRGNFTASRTAADTTTGLIIPIQNGKATYPTAGTVIRNMKATVTFAGASAVSTTRREVLTYDGSATAKLVITKDGETKTCTIALPRGRPNCS